MFDFLYKQDLWQVSDREVSQRRLRYNLPHPSKSHSPLTHYVLYIIHTFINTLEFIFSAGTTSRDSSQVFKNVDLWLRAWLWSHYLSRSYTGHCALRKMHPFWAVPLRRQPPGQSWGYISAPRISLIQVLLCKARTAQRSRIAPYLSLKPTCHFQAGVVWGKWCFPTSHFSSVRWGWK